MRLFLSVLFFSAGGLASAGEHSSGARLELVERRRLEAPSPLANAIYVSPTGRQLLAAGGYSADNGQTWEKIDPFTRFDGKLPFGYRREIATRFYDPVENCVVAIVNAMDTPGVDPAAIEPPVALNTYYLRYRVSTDGGRSYVCDEPLVTEGHTAERPLDGVQVGKNALFMGDAGSQTLRTRAGKLLVPAQACLLGADGELSSPGGGFTYTDAVTLIGEWADDHRLKWRAAQRVEGDPARSTRGMIEPTLAEMPDGRILMVLRGSNGGTKDPDYQLAGYRWQAVSEDGGEHWSTPEPWRYDDGETFFSPSSMSQLLAHSSGRYFWIGNICPTNPQGNSPRWPLVIGEVDARTLRLVRSSVIEIDTRQDEDTEGVELSAHAAAFEDRATGEIVLAMQRYTGGYKSSQPFVYRIALGGD
jgi:hypothetical protein